MIYFQQQALTVKRKIAVMQDIVHRYGDQLAHLLKKFQIRFAVGRVLETGKSHGPQAPQGGGEGNDAERIHAVLRHALSDFGPTVFFGEIAHEERLLRPLQSHGVTRGVVQAQGDEVDGHDARKESGKVPEEFVRITMRGIASAISNRVRYRSSIVPYD